MVELKVTITTKDGEVLDTFIVHAMDRDTDTRKRVPTVLAEAVREHIEQAFEVED